MKKLSTFYKKDPKDLGLVINEVNPENEWVFKSRIPTRKFVELLVPLLMVSFTKDLT
jgi:hypothetical protein